LSGVRNQKSEIRKISIPYQEDLDRCVR